MMKEPIAGALSFVVEATYPGHPLPVRSGPFFISVIGGVPKKEQRATFATQKAAGELFVHLKKRNRFEDAKRGTLEWLSQQPEVATALSAPGQDIVVQYKSGVSMILRVMPPGPEK